MTVEVVWTDVEAAPRLGCKVSTLRRWRWSGGGPPYVKIGRLVRYRPTDIAEWLAAQRRISTSDPGSAAP